MAVKIFDAGPRRDAGTFDSAEFAHSALESPRALASVMDHTLLAPDAVDADIVRLCEEAVAFGFACAVVAPCWISLAHSVLAGSGVPAGTTIGFPLGTSLARSKREEAVESVKLGARELDTVMNAGLVKSGMNSAVEREIRGVVEVAHEAGAKVKVILESSLFSVEQKLRAAELAIQAGADFLKTSTGFQGSPTTPSDVALLRGVAGSRCGVKAAGGIRTLAAARAMLEAGASRLGSSRSVDILRAWDDSRNDSGGNSRDGSASISNKSSGNGAAGHDAGAASRSASGNGSESGS